MKEMATLSLKAQGVTIMPFQLRRMNGPPPMERRTCMSFKIQKQGGDIFLHLATYHICIINLQSTKDMYRFQSKEKRGRGRRVCVCVGVCVCLCVCKCVHACVCARA